MVHANPTRMLPSAQVARLYKRYGAVIYSRAKRVLKDDAEAEDATQEVFMRVMRHIERIPEDDAALAWIHRICTNYCLNVVRSRKSHARDLGPLDTFCEGPERRLANREFAERVIARAPEKVASTGRLYYVDGLEQQTVAEAMKVTRRTVCTRLEQFLETARELQSREELAANTLRVKVA
jgi:RNA polymerase sigma-70 factor, ECF subfamily